ncbi:MAG: hypothetical protein AABZ47_13525, partial [Planctomycetota bacterium]
MRRSKGSAFRPTVVRIIDGKRRKVKSRFYWVAYRDADGRPRRHALVLSNGSRVSDQAVADSELRKTLLLVERQAAGLVDKTVSAASTPMRVVLARYIRHLRRARLTRNHIAQSLTCGKWFIDKGPMQRLADFTDAERIDRCVAAVLHAGRSPRTANVYRRTAHSLGQWCVRVAKLLDHNPVTAVALRD